ncbi:MAG: CoA-binding protein [Ectothiorhodospiraceae bacterium]|nr:CoA-binding protein [Ectothiorhodospiraceae bacterium]
MADIPNILRNAKNIAIVGLSDKPSRDSYMIAKHLQNAGYNIFPVNPTIDEWNGQKSYPTVQSIDEDIDIVDVFRRSEHVPEIVEQTMEKGADVLWLQLGIHHDDAVKKAEKAGITVVQDACIKVEHMHL